MIVEYTQLPNPYKTPYKTGCISASIPLAWPCRLGRFGPTSSFKYSAGNSPYIATNQYLTSRQRRSMRAVKYLFAPATGNPARLGQTHHRNEQYEHSKISRLRDGLKYHTTDETISQYHRCELGVHCSYHSLLILLIIYANFKQISHIVPAGPNIRVLHSTLSVHHIDSDCESPELCKAGYSWIDRDEMALLIFRST